MITDDEDIALVVEKLRAHFGGYSDREPAIAKELLDSLANRSVARERAYLQFAEVGWSSVRSLAVAFNSPASERAALEALARIEARRFTLDGRPAQEPIEFDAAEAGASPTGVGTAFYVMCYRSSETPEGPWSVWRPHPMFRVVDEEYKHELKNMEFSGQDGGGFYQRRIMRCVIS